MAYLALYRRFRPTSFQEVIGQDAIVRTLTNQINSKSVGHAYLFCGARGTGKTTLAKILARAVNCLNPVDGSPCSACAACKILENPSDLNVVEMDAASNNKVENVRAIRDNVQFPPVGVKYKVYIIDEVHMLTTEAFNALLKTLEEPPSHAIFILATTEPQKIPATILSRCMRFDFKLVSTEKIAELIKNIYDELAKDYDLDAITAIAKAGNGSVRDALSVADTLISYGDGKLTYNDVLEVLGATDLSVLDGLSRAIFSSDAGTILSIADELGRSGKSVNVVCRDLLSYMRDLGIIKSVKNAEAILNLPTDRFLIEKATAELVGERKLLRAMEVLSTVENNARYSLDPRTVFETALLKAALPEADYDIDALLARIGELEREIKDLKEKGVKVVNTPPKVIFKTENHNAEKELKTEIKTAKEIVIDNEVGVTVKCKSTEPTAIVVDEKADNKVSEITQETNKKFSTDIEYDGEFGYSLSDDDVPPAEFYGEVDLNASKSAANNISIIKFKEDVYEANKGVITKKTPDINSTSLTGEKTADTPNKNGVNDLIISDGKRIWGMILRKLRSMPNKTVLWVACQEMNAKVEGSKLVVNPGGENERKLLLKEDNLSVIKLISEGFGITSVELGGNDDMEDSCEKKAIEFFGAENLTIIK